MMYENNTMGERCLSTFRMQYDDEEGKGISPMRLLDSDSLLLLWHNDFSSSDVIHPLGMEYVPRFPYVLP